MQRMDSFGKPISKCLSNGKGPKHEADLLLHIKGLLYKLVTDSHQKVLALLIPKAWKYTMLLEAHDKLGHQGATLTYYLIKMPILLERHEQEHKEIHRELYNMLQGKSQGSVLPSANDTYTAVTIWQNSHRLGNRMLNFCFRQQAYSHHHWSSHRMVGNLPHTRQLSRYYSIHIH